MSIEYCVRNSTKCKDDILNAWCVQSQSPVQDQLFLKLKILKDRFRPHLKLEVVIIMKNKFIQDPMVAKNGR